MGRHPEARLPPRPPAHSGPGIVASARAAARRTGRPASVPTAIAEPGGAYRKSVGPDHTLGRPWSRYPTPSTSTSKAPARGSTITSSSPDSNVRRSPARSIAARMPLKRQPAVSGVSITDQSPSASEPAGRYSDAAESVTPLACGRDPGSSRRSPGGAARDTRR